MQIHNEGAQQQDNGAQQLHFVDSARPARIKRTKPFSIDSQWFRAVVSTEFAIDDPLPDGAYRLEFEDEDGPGEIRLIPA